MLKLGLIGTNLQGRRRALALKACNDVGLVATSSAHFERAEAFCREFGGTPMRNWQDIITQDLDAVLICTPVHLHAEMAMAALRAGKHVLCEKPLARTLQEGKQMIETARASGRLLKCGFNHRYHPAIKTAKERLDAGEIGAPYFIRCRYGICGRAGYEKEWRMDPQKVGGGCLMEHGIHAVDLFRWFLGDLETVGGFVANYTFQADHLEDNLEDNAFSLFRSNTGAIAQLHASLTQWRNLFSFEVHGENGYLSIEGLGGSYGTESLVRGYRAFDRPFQEERWDFRNNDISWSEEWMDFRRAIEEHREPWGTAEDGLEALKLVQAVYQSSREGRWVSPQGVSV